MSLLATRDADRVREWCHAVVAADPLGATMFGSIAEWATRPGAAPWAARPEDRPMVLVARSHRDTPATFSAGWEAGELATLAPMLDALDPPPASIAGPGAVIDMIGPLLTRTVADRTAERLYRLDHLVEPRGVRGRPRLADLDDVDVLADWYAAFQHEVFGSVSPNTPAMVRNGLAAGRCWLWLADADAPRAFAQRRPAVHGVSRIGPVFTPTEFRGRGFGSGATAAATRDILEEGAVPCLYTDLSNPTSNRIYQALGYVPVMDRALVRYR